MTWTMRLRCQRRRQCRQQHRSQKQPRRRRQHRNDHVEHDVNVEDGSNRHGDVNDRQNREVNPERGHVHKRTVPSRACMDTTMPTTTTEMMKMSMTRHPCRRRDHDNNAGSPDTVYNCRPLHQRHKQPRGRRINEHDRRQQHNPPNTTAAPETVVTSITS